VGVPVPTALALLVGIPQLIETVVPEEQEKFGP
jgi:hypothetical protein